MAKELAAAPDLPEIAFEGKVAKPKSGAYLCPFGCGPKGYPKSKWKTEKGFRKHMESCDNSPLAKERANGREVAAQAEREVKKIAALEAFKVAQDGLGKAVGDEIFYVQMRVIAPTHVRKFDRMVRVRYEELREFEGCACKIEFFGFDHSLYINHGIRLGDLCESLTAARAEATKRRAAHQEHLDFSAMCR